MPYSYFFALSQSALNSSVLNSSQLGDSPFYPGKTTYGGAAAAKAARSRPGTPYQVSVETLFVFHTRLANRSGNKINVLLKGKKRKINVCFLTSTQPWLIRNIVYGSMCVP